MGLARSSAEGGRSVFLILAFVFPAMIAAAMALAYYGYQGAQDVEASARRQFIEAAGVRARDLMDRVEVAMNEQINPLFRQLGEAIDDTLLESALKCDAVGEVPFIVEAFAISRVDPRKTFECMGSGRLDAKAKDRFKKEVIQSKHFEWANVPFVQLKYVHSTSSGPILYAVTRHKAPDETSYFLIAKLDFQMVWIRWLQDAQRKLGQQYRVSLVDERGNTLPDSVYGGPEPMHNERFLFQEPVSKNSLYALTLRIAQPEEKLRDFEAQFKRQGLIQILLVILSTVIIAVGMGIVLLSVMAERRASRLKSDFIANVSHELKTPLSLIRMFGEMVATGRHKGEETAREYGGIITRESERLAHLIDNVLDFARLERGKASYDFAEGNLAEVVERALDVCRYRLDKEKMKLRTRIDRQLPPVRMDENALTLVVLNLVDNALKYAVDGGVVEVSLGRVPGGVVLGVRDYGAGIPRDEQTRIFERFYRAQSARDRNVRGSGIGLALVRHIAEAHGGRVAVESPIPAALGAGPGSLFRVFLPAPVVEVEEADRNREEGDRMEGPVPADPGPQQATHAPKP